MKIYIKQATKNGYIACDLDKGGIFDAAYPTSKLRRGRVQGEGGISPALTCGTTILRALKETENMEEEKTENKKKYRIRKLTPLETWRLMNFSDEDFEKAAYKKQIFYLEGDKEKCNAKLKVVQEKSKQTDLETYALCTINDSSSMEILKTIMKLSINKESIEKMQNVNVVIEKLEGMELMGTAVNTTRCIDFMGMQCTLMEEKDLQATVIIVQEKKDRQNTVKSMKITTELNLNQNKLYTILILLEQIMQLKIFGSTTLKVNIQGCIAITDVYENSIALKILNLEMETISQYVSSSQLYKQAGNSIVVSCLIAIFSQLGIQSHKRWNEMTVSEREKEVWKGTVLEK